MTLLSGASSLCQQGTVTGARKAPQRGVEDFPFHVFVVMEATVRAQPSSSTAQLLQGAPGAGPHSSSYSQARIPSEEELTMIDLRVLPPSCKDLAFASVHLTPFEFHKGLKQCFQRKLFKCALANNIQVSTCSVLSSFLSDEPHVSKLLLFSKGLITCYCL